MAASLAESFCKVISVFRSVAFRRPGVRLLQNVTLQRDLFNTVARHVLANQALPRVSSRPNVFAPVTSNHIAMPPCPYFCNLFTAVLVFVFLLISCGCLSIFSESYVCIFPLTSQSWAILVSDFSLFIEMILFCLSWLIWYIPVRCSEAVHKLASSVYCIALGNYNS